MFQWRHLAMDICSNGAIWRWAFVPMAPFGDGHLLQLPPTHERATHYLTRARRRRAPRGAPAKAAPEAGPDELRSKFKNLRSIIQWRHLAIDICSNGAIWR